MINPVDLIPRQTYTVVGRSISVATAGDGRPVVFVHGNATYSYAWRNVIHHLARRYRCLAPDLIGMGRSELIFPSGSSSYSFADHMNYLELLLERADLDEPFVIIGHELGAALAIQYAILHRDAVAAVCIVEGVFRVTNDETMDERIRTLLLDVRRDPTEELVLRYNVLIEDYLPGLVLRHLHKEEMDSYRSPYLKLGEPRRAMLSMARSLPISSDPGPIDDLAEQLRMWCSQASIPKLVVGGKPGHLVPPAVLATTAKWRNTTTAAINGAHFLMEDSPARLTMVIADWLEDVGYV